MIKLVFTVVAFIGMAAQSSVHAASSRTDQMLKLSPETRLEQRCDARAMGSVGREHKGLGGVELAFNSQISGKPGKAIRLSDGLRRSVDRQVLLQPTAGATLELTLDQTIQHIAERELKAGVEKHDAVSGIAVVLDPLTGVSLGGGTFAWFFAIAWFGCGAGVWGWGAVVVIFGRGSRL